MEQKTEASQACPKNFGHPHDYSLREDGKCAYCQHDEEALQALHELVPFPPMPAPPGGYAASVRFDRAAMKQYALLYANLVVAALKAQPASTEAAQGNSSNNSSSSAQGEDSALLAQDCIESIASGHGYMDSYGSFHCACCGADLDEKEDHSDECLTIRAQKFLARASAETGGVKP